MDRSALEGKLNLQARELLRLIERLSRAEGYCWASRQELAQMRGLSVHSIDKYLAQFRRLGLVAVKRTNRTNRIWITTPESPKITTPESPKITTPESPKITTPESPPSIMGEIDLEKEEGHPLPDGGKSADERIQFFQQCALVADRGQTDRFLKDCERLAAYRRWSHAGDPEMFGKIWWHKFRRYKTEEFTAAVDAFIEAADVPFDRPGVAGWLQKWIDKQRREKKDRETRRQGDGEKKEEGCPRFSEEQRQRLQLLGLLKPKVTMTAGPPTSGSPTSTASTQEA